MRFNDALATCTLALLLAPVALGCGGSGHGSSGFGFQGSSSSTTTSGDTLAVVSGDAQTGVAGQTLAQPLVVSVTDAQGNAVSGASVTFAATSGGGTLSNTTVVTDASGQASASLTLGTSPGTNAVVAELGTQGASVTFGSVALAPGSSQVTSNPSSVDFGTTNTGAAATATVLLTNAGANPVHVTSVSASGPDLAASGLTLPLTLAPAQTATLTLTFTPQSIGTETGTVTVQSDGIGSPLVISTTGVGKKHHSVTLTWNASTSAGVTGYNVYRSNVTGGPYAKINTTLVSGLTYQDDNVQSGATYFYVTTAVDSSGLESGYSTEVSATIPTP